MFPANTDGRTTRLGGSHRAVEASPGGPSPSHEEEKASAWRLLLFLVWMMVALLGEVGLVVSIAGLFVQGAMLWTAAQFSGLAAISVVAPFALWWVGVGLSALLLTIGLIGLMREQREARGGHRNRAETPDERSGHKSQGNQAARAA